MNTVSFPLPCHEVDNIYSVDTLDKVIYVLDRAGQNTLHHTVHFGLI